jgi:hypothetical protein
MSVDAHIVRQKFVTNNSFQVVLSSRTVKYFSSLTFKSDKSEQHLVSLIESGLALPITETPSYVVFNTKSVVIKIPNTIISQAQKIADIYFGANLGLTLGWLAHRVSPEVVIKPVRIFYEEDEPKKNTRIVTTVVHKKDSAGRFVTKNGKDPVKSFEFPTGNDIRNARILSGHSSESFEKLIKVKNLGKFETEIYGSKQHRENIIHKVCDWISENYPERIISLHPVLQEYLRSKNVYHVVDEEYACGPEWPEHKDILALHNISGLTINAISGIANIRTTKARMLLRFDKATHAERLNVANSIISWMSKEDPRRLLWMPGPMRHYARNILCLVF